MEAKYLLEMLFREAFQKMFQSAKHCFLGSLKRVGKRTLRIILNYILQRVNTKKQSSCVNYFKQTTSYLTSSRMFTRKLFMRLCVKRSEKERFLLLMISGLGTSKRPILNGTLRHED